MDRRTPTNIEQTCNVLYSVAADDDNDNDCCFTLFCVFCLERLTLKIDAVSSFETSLTIYKSISRNISEESYFRKRIIWSQITYMLMMSDIT